MQLKIETFPDGNLNTASVIRGIWNLIYKNFRLKNPIQNAFVAIPPKKI